MVSKKNFDQLMSDFVNFSDLNVSYEGRFGNLSVITQVDDDEYFFESFQKFRYYPSISNSNQYSYSTGSFDPFNKNKRPEVLATFNYDELSKITSDIPDDISEIRVFKTKVSNGTADIHKLIRESVHIDSDLFRYMLTLNDLYRDGCIDSIKTMFSDKFRINKFKSSGNDMRNFFNSCEDFVMTFIFKIINKDITRDEDTIKAFKELIPLIINNTSNENISPNEKVRISSLAKFPLSMFDRYLKKSKFIIHDNVFNLMDDKHKKICINILKDIPIYRFSFDNSLDIKEFSGPLNYLIDNSLIAESPRLQSDINLVIETTLGEDKLSEYKRKLNFSEGELLLIEMNDLANVTTIVDKKGANIKLNDLLNKYNKVKSRKVSEFFSIAKHSVLSYMLSNGSDSYEVNYKLGLAEKISSARYKKLFNTVFNKAKINSNVYSRNVVYRLSTMVDIISYNDMLNEDFKAIVNKYVDEICNSRFSYDIANSIFYGATVSDDDKIDLLAKYILEYSINNHSRRSSIINNIDTYSFASRRFNERKTIKRILSNFDLDHKTKQYIFKYQLKGGN